ncbi:hypothetical protein AGLY_005388 [Aphis glycines]|uniref:Uncharacterized protein n=1 Tax=Aphis glycines TaxID=307491 RepID=A0A6G0TV49_APHGL|nr:hypothetical protein AGLY_005388 [Aphis glycines]
MSPTNAETQDDLALFNNKKKNFMEVDLQSGLYFWAGAIHGVFAAFQTLRIPRRLLKINQCIFSSMGNAAEYALQRFIKMENELIMSTMLNEKGENILKVVNDFKFGCHKNYSNGDIRWRCTNKNCRAFLRIVAENKIKVSASNLIHNHDKTECKAITDLSERPSKLFHTQLKEENVPTPTITHITYIT